MYRITAAYQVAPAQATLNVAIMGDIYEEWTSRVGIRGLLRELVKAHVEPHLVITLSEITVVVDDPTPDELSGSTESPTESGNGLASKLTCLPKTPDDGPRLDPPWPSSPNESAPSLE